MTESWFDLKANHFHYFHPPPAYFTKDLIWLHKYIEMQYHGKLRK